MITLICGLPNAGKTTYSSRYDSVIHFDAIPHTNTMEQFAKCNEMASKASGDVCVEGVYNSVKRRKELLKACIHHDRKVCIWLDTPLEECLSRERSYRKRPLDITRSHHRTFEPPTLSEGWDEIIRIEWQQQD